MFVWNIDPTFFTLFGRGIRYYGVLFALALMGAYSLWLWQVKRGGYEKKVGEGFLIWGVAATIIGSRLGHCLFYEPERYLSDPISILYFWEGGLASHGATIGLVIALLLYGRKVKMRIPEVLDRFSMSAAFAAAFVRLGNFMNSEIVGRINDGFFKVKFPRYDRRALRPCLDECGKVAKDVCDYVGDQCYNLANVPWRYPSQLFEFVMGLLVLLMLWLADRLAGKEKRPIGMLGSLFFVLYFTARFTVEFFKEYQTLSPDESILTMGQYLSLPFICLGGIGLWIAMSHRTPTCIYRPAGAAPLTAEGVPVEEKSAAEAPAKAEAGENCAAEVAKDAKETEAGAVEAAKDAKETEAGAAESEAGAAETESGAEENEKGEA